MNELTDCVTETLSEDGDFVLSRVKRAVGLPPCLIITLVSESTAPACLVKLENAYALREMLDPAWAAQPVELVRFESKPALLVHDPGGEILEVLVGRPIELRQGLRIAIGLTSALGHLHARELIHRDLKPANVLVKPATSEVWLTGFGLTSRLPRHRQSPEPPEFLAGTLAYMAPEQTGRMNRSVDSRSDLYSLGVTLYQMIVGELPFTASDPMEWVHCHIARLPTAPKEKVVKIPEPISAIVMKLMAKAPEERYQTAAGVEADLRRCLTALEAHGRIDPFPPGAHDVPDRLLIPEHLYGREKEIEQLLAAFDRVGNGRAELVLVSGYSGVGKSSVVNELRKALVPPRGLFASGKFDQYMRDIPYATLAQAFEKLVSQILTQSEAEVGRWRDSLIDALGSNGQLIVNLIPKLEIIIGEQPPVAELPPQDTTSRFQRVLRRFIGVFARQEHPLALFLDDLQWLDAATIELIEHLLTEPDVRHLLIVGAYRDNEVGPVHPLMQTLAGIKLASASVEQIVLKPLAREDLERLIADSIHAGTGEVRSLAALVFEKTGGNPFFAIQFLMALADEALLRFDASTAAWTWEMARIRSKQFTENVADLMAAKLDRLPEATKNALAQLACLGNVAEIGTMTLVLGGAVEEVHAALWEAVRAGFLFRSERSYTFLHDRVQEAAYALVPDDEQAAVHLRIGRVHMASLAPAEIEEGIFEIVSQFDRGMALIDSPAEREQVAALNLKAAKRAKGATAYASALRFLAAGRSMQPQDCWEQQYRLTFELEMHRAECEFLTGAHAAAEERLLALSKRAATLVDRAAVTRMRMALYTTLDRGDRAVEVSLEYLREADINWSHQPDEQDIQREHEQLWQRLGDRSIEELVDLPLMEDLNWWATLDVLVELVPTAMVVSYHRLLDLTLLRMANLALQHGNCDGSAYAFASLNVVLGFRFGDYQAGLRFGELGCALVESRGLDRFKIRAFANFGIFTVPWTKSMPIGRAMILRGFDAALTTSDVTYAIYCSNSLVAHSLISGEPLDKVYQEAQRSRAFAEKAGFGLFVNITLGETRLIQDLRGHLEDEVFLGDARRVGGSFEQDLDDAGPQMAFASSICWVRKMQRCFFAGDYAAALEAAVKASHRLVTAPYILPVGDYHFYSALLRAAVFDSASEAERALHSEALSAHHRQIEVWARSCPENFGNRAALIGAEIARIQGRDLEAQLLYEAAIRSAKDNGFIQNEALAYEVAARYYEARGFGLISETYLRKAHSAFLQWGATGKARQMEQCHPWLRPSPQSHPVNETPVGQLELATMVKVSRVLSGEIVLERLIERLLVVAVEHAGAVRGLLLLPHGGELRIEAEATTRHDTVAVLLRQASATSEELPEMVFRYVARSQEHVLLDDAQTPNPFSADEYLQRKRSRSVLCLPLVRQARLAGVLYLENDLAAHVFTPPRIDLLKLLASQAAISLENSHLYHDLQQAEEKARLSERELRLAIDTIPALAWNSWADGSNETFSKQWHDYTGVTPEDACNGGWMATYHPDDISRVTGKWSEMLAAGTTGGVEARIRRFDGEYRTFLVRGVPLRDESGAITKWYGTCTDIEDLKRAEMELRRSKVYLEHAQKLSHTGAVGLRVSDGKLLWSEEAARIYGYDPGTEATAERILQRVHPDDVALLTDVLSRAARGGASFDFQHRLLMPDGAIKYLRSLALSVKDEKGIEEVLGAITDITEQYQAKAALEEALAKIKKSEDELRTTIDTIPGLVWTTLPEGAGEFFSQRWLDYTGLSTEEAQGDGWAVALHPDDTGMVFDVWTQMIATKKPGEVEARLRRSDGEYRWFLFRGAPLIDQAGNVVKWYGTNTDIEDFKRAEDELRRSQAFLAQAQKLTKTGSLWWKVATGQIIWSEESYRFLDYPLSVTPSVELIMQRCHPDDLDLVQRTVARSAQEGADMDFEHRLLMPDGSVKHIHVLVQNVGLEAGKPEFVGAVTDITERKKAEENLRKAHAELAHVTRVTTMGELAASIAHEVSQPIAGVVINGTASLRWLAGLTEDSVNLTEAREALQRIIRDGKRAGDVIGRIRTLFKKAETVKEPLDLNEAVREIMLLIKSEMDKRRVIPRLELADELPAVIGDRVQLQQVMMNLILNALEAMSTVEERPRILVLGTQVHDQSSVLITVRDTGSGLDSESMEKVFAAFHTTKPGGLGMGLSISRSIVENHSGRLWVTANDGPGVTFQFTLLATDAAADSQLKL